MAYQLLLFISAVSVNFAGSARILCIYPLPFHSHELVFNTLTETLSKHGHELVVMTTAPHKRPLDNVTEIDVRNISHTIFDKGLSDILKQEHSRILPTDPVTLVSEVLKTLYDMVDAQFSVPEMQALIKYEEQHFDLILIEECVPLALMINAKFKAPVVLVSSYYANLVGLQITGAETHPIFYPDNNMKNILDMTFWDRLLAFYYNIKLHLAYKNFEKLDCAMIKKHFGDEAPSMQELRKTVQMMFLNIHHTWDSYRAVSPSIHYIGAIHLKEPKALPESLKHYLDSSHQGVIYMSLGSKFKSSELPQETIRVIMKVFASLPYNIIWKWEDDQLPEKPKNVRFEKWLPQSDMLHHPSMKVFITHAGLQSTDEAIAANVPLIGLPIFVDQFGNAQKYMLHGIGIQLDIHSVHEDELRQAILTVAEERRFRDNIKRLSRVMEEQRSGAMNKTLHFIDYVAKHGTTFLHSPRASVSIAEYYVFDIIAVLSFIIIIVLAFIVMILKYLARITKTPTFKIKHQLQ